MSTRNPKKLVINVGDHEITIRSTAKTRATVLVGWNIIISDNRGNDERMFQNCIGRDEAVDKAFVKFVGLHGMTVLN